MHIDSPIPLRLKTKVIMTITLCVFTYLLGLASGFGGIIAKAGPSFTEPSIGDRVFSSLYFFSTFAISISAIWVRSRPLLVTATCLIFPVLLGSIIIAFIAPFAVPLVLLPIAWIWFFRQAWPYYENSAKLLDGKETEDG